MANKDKKKKNSTLILYRNIVRSLKLYWQIDKKSLIILLIVAFLTSLLPALQTYIWSEVINKGVEYFTGNYAIINDIYRFFVYSIIVELTLMFLWQIQNYYERMCFYTWHEYMYIAVPRKISQLDFEKFENPKFNNLLNLVASGYGHIPGDFTLRVTQLFGSIVAIILSISIISTYSLYLLPILIISLIPGIYYQLKSGRRAWGIWDAKGDISREASKLTKYLETDSYIKEVRIFQLRNHLLNLTEGLFKTFQKEFRNNDLKRTIYTSTTGLLENGVQFGIQLWLFSKMFVPNSTISIGDFNFINSALNRLSGDLRELVRNITKLYEDNNFMKKLFELFDTETTIKSKPDALKLISNQVPKIEFRNVSFKYSGSNNYVYKNLNIIINPGEDIALVGENGAGKTTFIKLLLRFYDVTDGEILINDVNIKDIDLETYYKQIGVLFQDFNKYYFSVANNIAVGNTEKEIDQLEIEDKAKQAGAYEFIEKYKKKFNQLLSKSFKNGIEPSGGQWQRIALARAFYRDANILILDEPTSAIDPKGEYEIFEEISKVQKEKTTIIISHRFSTVRNADKIYVIDKGEILESGSHEELISNPDSKYKEMFELQAEGYK